MNDEEINRAIAEHLGWEKVSGGFGIETRYKGTPSETRVTLPVPNYCRDLNAMHEAEKALTNKDLWEMTMQLCNIVYGDVPLAHATARQRAEAFLRTVGKWRGEE
jgi:hypothetical protein